jgi:hypothetical protein
MLDKHIICYSPVVSYLETVEMAVFCPKENYSTHGVCTGQFTGVYLIHTNAIMCYISHATWYQYPDDLKF